MFIYSPPARRGFLDFVRAACPASSTSSTARSRSQWELPDLRCQIECQIGCQIECRNINQIKCQTEIQIECQNVYSRNVRMYIPERMPDGMSECIFQKECQIECQNMCQVECQIECQNMCQIEYQLVGMKEFMYVSPCSLGRSK